MPRGFSIFSDIHESAARSGVQSFLLRAHALRRRLPGFTWTPALFHCSVRGDSQTPLGSFTTEKISRWAAFAVPNTAAFPVAIETASALKKLAFGELGTRNGLASLLRDRLEILDPP